MRWKTLVRALASAAPRASTTINSHPASSGTSRPRPDAPQPRCMYHTDTCQYCTRRVSDGGNAAVNDEPRVSGADADPVAAEPVPVAEDPDPGGADAIGVIELELIKLVRHLETFGRRSSLYVRVDRAGYLAMRVLDGLGPVTANSLAQELSLDASTVTRQITALEQEGFVERCANP